MESMNLSELNFQMEAIISGFSREMSEAFVRRLRELGFHESCTVKCLKLTPFGGPKVYSVGGAVFSISDDIANKILVSGDRKRS